MGTIVCIRCRVILFNAIFICLMMIVPTIIYGDEVPVVGLVKCIDCDDLKEQLQASTIQEMEKIVDSVNVWEEDDWEGGDDWDGDGYDNDSRDKAGYEKCGLESWDDSDYCGGTGCSQASDSDQADSGDDDDHSDDMPPTDDDSTDDDFYDDDSYDDDDSVDDDDDGQSHSDTNVQEEGVDEDDIIKTDGEYLYLSSGGYLLIFDVDPAQSPRELGRIDIEGIVTGMYLYDNLAIIFSKMDKKALSDGIWPDSDRESMAPTVSKITIVNVTLKSFPIVARETYVEGSLVDTRRIAGTMHVVINGIKRGPVVNYRVSGNHTTKEDFERAIQALKRKNRGLIRRSPMDNWMGRVFDVKHKLLAPKIMDKLLTPCDQHYHPNLDQGTTLLTVLSYELDNHPDEFSTVSIMADGLIVYASSEHIYVTENILAARDLWSDNSGKFPDTIQIHAFDLQEQSGSAIYAGSGEVPGFVLNQFSMSEFEGYLRVATTIGFDYWDTSSGVYVFELEDSQLVLKGALENIAFHEELYAARFIGDKGYLVTYPIPMPDEDEYDPLFTVDLTNPFKPVLVGELEIPGFSTYIHPIGENHLLTIGEGGDWFSAHGGVALSIFDVSDFADPKRIHYTDLGSWGVTSEAKFDHHALLYYSPFDLLAIPLDVESWSGLGESFTGIFAFKATVENGFDLEATIDHSGFQGEEGSDDYNWLSKPRRSVVIGDYLYTISDLGIIVSAMPGWVTEASLDLPWQNY